MSLTDGPGYHVGSPGSATVTLTSDDVAPDLAVSALTGPAAAAAGVAISVNETTKNQGTGDATASVTRYYLSANGSVDVADTVLGSRILPTLAVGASSAATVTLTIPAATATGTYYVIAMADADAALGEIVESNNQRSFVTRIGPDLQILGVTAPLTAAGGAAIVVGDTTKNKGAGGAGRRRRHSSCPRTRRTRRPTRRWLPRRPRTRPGREPGGADDLDHSRGHSRRSVLPDRAGRRRQRRGRTDRN